MRAPKIHSGRFVAEAAVVVGAVAAGLHWATALELNAAVAVAGLGAIAAAGWIAIGGVGAPNDVGAPHVAMNGFMDGRASQGAMMIAQEVLLQEQMNFEAAKRSRPERAHDRVLAGRRSHVVAWACVAVGVVAIAVAAFV